jgi:hypothetical protein
MTEWLSTWTTELKEVLHSQIFCDSSKGFILLVLVDNISLEIPLQEVASGELYLKLRERADTPVNHSVFWHRKSNRNNSLQLGREIYEDCRAP